MAKYIGIKAILDEFKKRILLLAHPVHSLYMSTDPTSPETLFGGKWDSLPAGCFVRNAGGDAGTVGQTQNEGLPNLEGWFNIHPRWNGSIEQDNSLFQLLTSGVAGDWINESSNTRAVYREVFNAHNYNPIFGNSSHVTPYNVAVYMWWRTR